MMKKWYLLALMFCMMSALASATQLGENITLRAACLDVYGNLCGDAARWTVILPNGSVLYNNLEGGNVSYGIRNLSLWLNETGTWFVLTNFSGFNITREYNVVVEDYTTPADIMLLEDGNLTGVLIFLGILVFCFLYLALRMDEKHASIKWFLVLVALVTGAFGFGYAGLSITGGDVEGLLSTGYYFMFVIIGLLIIYIIYNLLVTLKVLFSEVSKRRKNG